MRKYYIYITLSLRKYVISTCNLAHIIISWTSIPKKMVVVAAVSWKYEHNMFFATSGNDLPRLLGIMVTYFSTCEGFDLPEVSLSLTLNLFSKPKCKSCLDHIPFKMFLLPYDDILWASAFHFHVLSLFSKILSLTFLCSIIILTYQGLCADCCYLSTTNIICPSLPAQLSQGTLLAFSSTFPFFRVVLPQPSSCKL